jgi:hypothetical protein
LQKKRQAIHGLTVFTGTAESITGCYAWDKGSGVKYYFVTTTVGIYTAVTIGTWTRVTSFPATRSGNAGFTEFIDATNTKSLVIVNGTDGYVFTSNAAGTQIIDVDFPTPHVPFPIFLDGYLFLAKAATGDIYNSDLNNPAAWTPGSFISSELYPDDIKALAKVNNYLLAIGTYGCEYFYDAANATASPLARYEGGSLPFGVVTANSVASNLNKVVFLANNNDGELTLKYIEDFKHKDIDAGFLINALIEYAAEVSSIMGFFNGYFLRHGGQLLYVLVYRSTAANNRIAFAYCFDTEMWITLADTNTTTAFSAWYASPPTLQAASILAGTMTNAGTSTCYAGFYGPSSGFPTTAVDVYTGFAGTTYSINTQIRTKNLNFGTYNVKAMSRLGVYATFHSYPGTTLSLTVKWTDDDYQTVTSGRTLSFTGTGTSNYPFINQLGQFRNRSFLIDYSGTSFIRYYDIEMDINKGQQ